MKVSQLALMLFSLSTAVIAAAKSPSGLAHRSIDHTEYDRALTPSNLATTSRVTTRAGSEWKQKMKQKLKQCVACGAPPDRVGTSSGEAITGGHSPPTFHGASTSRSRRVSPDGSRFRSTAPATVPGASTNRGGTGSPPCGTHRSPSPQRQGSPTSSHTVPSTNTSPSRGSHANQITMHNPDTTLPGRVDLRLIEGEYAVPFIVCPHS